MKNYNFRPEPDNATETEQKINDLHADMGASAAPYYLSAAELSSRGDWSDEHYNYFSKDMLHIGRLLKIFGDEHAIAVADKQAIAAIGQRRFGYLKKNMLRDCDFTGMMEIYEDIIARGKYANARLVRAAGRGMALVGTENETGGFLSQ